MKTTWYSNLLFASFAVALAASPARGHVRLDEPNGGEVLEAGTTVTIEWHIVITHNQQDWDLWYSTNGAGGPWIEIAMNLQPGSAAVGSIHTYQWTVPDTPSAQVRVRVRMDNTATDYLDESDADLAIVPAGGTKHIINQAGFAFSPSNITVQPLDVVEWRWSGSFHTVTSGTLCTSDGLFDAPLDSANTVFTYLIPNDGTVSIPYYCIPHCGVGMVGTITVTFHFMQIEQVIGGVNGDTTAQAIQLRMRALGQNLLAPARIRAWDAAGLNPVVVVDFPSSVPNGAAGARVLIASPNFVNLTSPATSPDFTMANLIPASYLNAGSLTFETDSGTIIYWRLSWGGNAYTGSTTGSIANDGDGDFGPPFPNPLPSTCDRALQFQGPSNAASTTNAADYALTSGSAVFANNAGASFTVDSVPDVCCADSECDDTVACTDDTCVAGSCVFTSNDANCANGLACDGDEMCDGALGCQDGTPLDCDDSVACTVDDCQEPSGCVNTPDDALCVDDGLFCNGDEFCSPTADCTSTGIPCAAGEVCKEVSDTCEPVIRISLELVAGGGGAEFRGGGAALVAPVFVTHAGDGSGRLFIVDQIGLIRIVDADDNLLPEPFLDITDRIVAVNPAFDERGLLGLAFHPDYANNGRFFVRYSAPREDPFPPDPCNADPPFFFPGCHKEVLAEYAVTANPNLADAFSEIILLTVDEPEFNHDSGQVMFGPDGLLYWTLGDGGGGNDDLHLNGLCDAGHCTGDDSVCSVSTQDCADETTCVTDLAACSVPDPGDPPTCSDDSLCLPSGTTPHGPVGNGQNPHTVLGSLLRMDVGAGATLPDDFPGDPDRNYAIPAGNPFADGVDGAPEIYAYGFRNPYRFSFVDFTDGANGVASAAGGNDFEIIVADVGQDLLEEINFVPGLPSPGPLNYGWAIREGFSCFDPFDTLTPPATCDATGPLGEALLDPVVDYPHPTPCESDADCLDLVASCGSEGFCTNPAGIAVIGGFVYGGSGIPELPGKYVFGDFGQSFVTPGGRLFYLDVDGPEAFEIREFFLAPGGDPLGLAVLGIGEDEDGELYLGASDSIGLSGNGAVYRIVCPVSSQPETDKPKSPTNRFLSIRAGDPKQIQAIRVTFVSLPPPFDIWDGMEFWAGQPREVCENSGKGLETAAADCPDALPTRTFWAAPLVCSKGEAHYMDWHGQCAAGTCVGGLEPGKSCAVDDDCQIKVSLYNEGIVPSRMLPGGGIDIPAEYEIQVIDEQCSNDDETAYSAPLTMIQAGWGDVCGPSGAGACTGQADGIVDVQNDVLGVLDKFANIIDLQKVRADIEPGDDAVVGGTSNGPDFKVNVANDVLFTLAAFGGAPYPFVPGDPCGPGL